MSDVKISALPAATSIANTDVAPVVTGGITKKASATVITSSALAASVAGTNPVLIGPATSANSTRFPNALSITSSTAAGIQKNESHNIGLIAEGTANASDTSIYGVGLYGVGYTASGTRCGGVIGEGHVSATGDTGSAIGVRGYANDTHAGGLNIGLYGNASGGASNYALYMAGGDILSTTAQTWTLGGDLTLSGGTLALSAGTANGVLYLNGSKAATSGSALTFDGTLLRTSTYLGLSTNTTPDTSTGDAIFYKSSTGATLSGYQVILETGSAGSRATRLTLGSDGTFRVKGAGTAGSTDAFQVSGSAPASSFLLDSAGNAGLGTSNPSAYAKLAVFSGSSPNTAFFDSTAASAYSASTYFANAVLTLRSGANASGNATGIRFSSSISGTLEGLFAFVQNSSTYGDFVWQSYNGSYAERMRLSSDGTFRVKGAGTAGSTDAFQVSGSAPASAFLLDSAGNAGLGATPSAWYSSSKVLQVGLGAALESRSTTSCELMANAYLNTSGVWSYQNTGASGRYQIMANNHYWDVATSGSAGTPISFVNIMTLGSDGTFRVKGAGTAGSTDAFQVSGSAPASAVSVTSGGALLVGTTSSSNSSGNGFKVINPAGTHWDPIVVTDANSATYSCWDLYSTGAGAYRFYVTSTGVINATSTTILAISDQRLKENIRDIDTGLDAVLALKPRRFDWKAGKGQDKKNAAGFIAQEFETVFPNSVGTSKAGEDGIEYKNICHEELIPTLVKAIQEQQTLIESLTARINTLEK